MKFENEWTQSHDVQKIAIGDLVRQNKELVIQIEDADVEVARLKLEISRLANGKLELTVKLKDAVDEVGRLTMVVKHQVADPAK